ncbi:hypothetical protein Pcinc_015820 [Petrolisthes cinctipes]|uniref:Ig-like domain-containing protein n=1 Tax=Petrolisthes cinctipes TaxID=88211 RepID=A0AAE1FSA1_PETCI|nr:hypothetical protein Pcinc_015820 [Petrolisthes cinctipes]
MGTGTKSGENSYYCCPIKSLEFIHHVHGIKDDLFSVAVWSVTGVAGRASDLPCYLNPRTPNDRPKLILWYKKGTRTPIFSYDGRIPPLETNNRHEGRQVTVSRDAATLTLSSVGLDAAGVYECRVDFFKSPTHNSLVNLTIVGK